MTDSEIIAELKREPAADLRRLQKQPYEWKVEHALDVIREFVEHEGETGVYVSFSGGKDSLVLLHLVRSIYPDVPAVFANTGIEFPEQVKAYREKAKPSIKKWAEEHRDRVRELGRKNDAKRRNSEKRKAWEAAYRQTDEYKERRREYERNRNQTPERKAWERERSKRRREAAKAAKTKESA